MLSAHGDDEIVVIIMSTFSKPLNLFYKTSSYSPSIPPSLLYLPTGPLLDTLQCRATQCNPDGQTTHHVVLQRGLKLDKETLM